MPAPSPGAQVADLAEEYVGSPYRWGGASPAGFDCTGFVMWVYSQFGVPLPHDEAGQLASGVAVSAEDLQPGDVLVFANTYRRGLSHVGIYLGEGQFVHAVDERHGVTVSALWDSYWAPRLVGAARDVPWEAAGVAHTYVTLEVSRYLLILTPRLRDLIAELQTNRNLSAHPEIYRRHRSEIV